MFLDRVIYFRGNLVDQVKGRSPKKLKLLIEVPNEAHLKVHILSYNMILISSPKRVPRLSCAFWDKFGRTGKGSLTDKAKIVIRASLISAPESTGSKLKYEPHLFSIARSLTELFVLGKNLGDQENFRPPK